MNLQSRAIRLAVIAFNLAWLMANIWLMARFSSRPMPWDYWALRAASIVIPLSSALVIGGALKSQNRTLAH